MSLGIEEILGAALGDRSVRFVFPSEICAEAWLGRALRIEGAPRALESERFLGWDRLKEKAASRGERPPVDDAMRRIFAASLLAENAARPFLKSIIPPEYAPEWQGFSGYLASRLPALGALPAALRSAGIEAGSSNAKLADWLGLRARYEAFLERTGRFEPSFEPRALRELPGRTVIFFPELIEDFDAYAPSLASSPSVRLVPLPPAPAGAVLRRPQTALAELRETLSEIGALMERGEEAADIAMTVTRLDRYRPYLEREAALLSVPLALRSGSSLSATPGGRLFAAMRDAASSGFSFDSLRDLLLSPAWPWKTPDTGRTVIREGMRLHAVAPWPEEGGRVADAWERSLSGPLRRWYRDLRSRIEAIARAEDFASLLKSYNVFKTQFLSADKDEWDEAADLSLARCVVELEGLARAEAETGLVAPGAAFGLFMHKLDSTQYVSAKASAGVSVYDWRVGAGIPAKRHFVLGSSQEAMVARYSSYDFLGEEMRDELGGERDAAPQFIAAYARSGEMVSFSCPELGFDGEETAHGSLISIAADEAAGDEARLDDSYAVEARLDDSYAVEAAWLSGRGPAPARLHARQRAGLEAAAAALPASAGDGAFLERATAETAAARLVREGEDRMSLDSTAIDYYLSCPYAYLYLRVLDAGAESSGIDFVDAFFLGDVYHAALERLFERIKEEDGALRPERASDYRAMVGPCLGEAFAGLAKDRGAFVAVVLEAYRGRLESFLSRLVDAELGRSAGLEIEALEAKLELDYPALSPGAFAPGGVVLRGKIDRLTRSERGAVIVDYKKGRVPAKAQVAPDESGAIAEAQIPCYLRLAAASGEALDSAWYLSIEGYERLGPGDAVCAFGDQDERGKGAYVGRAALDGFLAAFDGALEETARGIASGSYPLAAKERQEEACRECEARGICRERYALRFGGAARTRPGRREEEES